TFLIIKKAIAVRNTNRVRSSKRKDSYWRNVICFSILNGKFKIVVFLNFYFFPKTVLILSSFVFAIVYEVSLNTCF
ncbi:MAG TPA: hypothetical protein DCQ99_06375, partial [Nitrospinae bacterium]|nr:hypothetical protein [Nitrospinota bacterium]